MKRSFALVGGDLRQVYLAQLLEADGHLVRTLGLEQRRTQNETDLQALFDWADVIVLPMPLLQSGGRLNAPLACTSYRMAEVLDALPTEKPVLGGGVSAGVLDMAERRGIVIRDYLKREELAVRNAIPTAEGAIEIILHELPMTIHGLPVLIAGHGRIGQALAQRMSALGAEVTVSARKPEDFAWILSRGWKALDTRQLDGKLREFPLIVNTIPAPVFTEELLAQSRDDVLVLDLASGSGLEPEAEDLRRVIHANRLPGKCAPLTAAQAVRDTIYHMLEEGNTP